MSSKQATEQIPPEKNVIQIESSSSIDPAEWKKERKNIVDLWRNSLKKRISVTGLKNRELKQRIKLMLELMKEVIEEQVAEEFKKQRDSARLIAQELEEAKQAPSPIHLKENVVEAINKALSGFRDSG